MSIFIWKNIQAWQSQIKTGKMVCGSKTTLALRPKMLIIKVFCSIS